VIESLKNILGVGLVSTTDFQITIGQLLLVPFFLAIGYLGLKWLVSFTAKGMNERNVSPDVVQIVKRAIFIIGIIVLLITLLDFLHVPLTAFAFVSGAVAIGIGFGAQNIINNFISGWILMWERPIRINDYIEIGDTSGNVEEINTRSTRIRRVDGVHMLIPNSKLLEEMVVNWTLVDKLLRSIVRVGVAYGSDVATVKNVLEDVVASHPLVLEEPVPQVIFEDFGDSALVFDIYFWVNSAGEKSAREIRSDLRFNIEHQFRLHDIVISFPQRDVHVDGHITFKESSQAEPSKNV